MKDGTVVLWLSTTAHRHYTKSGSNPTGGVSEIHDDENL